MQVLVQQIQRLKKTELRQKIDQRLSEFHQFQTNTKTSQDWFSEFCFCLLTANAKSKTACAVQQELGAIGFATATLQELISVIRKNKHRFHNTKARYILAAREHQDIKEKVLKCRNPKRSQFENETEMREWLVANIKGYGYKEASHFLRNVGFLHLAILDRHVLNHLYENKIIRKIPSSLNQKNYLKMEKKMEQLCAAVSMTQAELDMYLWYMKAGDVLK
ncbi:N-glycosylase/DNA lyase [Candidatus Woesearchaeota archaeon]|nr:N-glycosylase/DNA lyase [Candidatus Woesearchaeota archaeon]